MYLSSLYLYEKENRISGKVLGGVNETIENRLNSNDSKSVSDFDGLNADDRTQKVIVKFSARGSSATTSSVDFFQPLANSNRLFESPVNITESLYNPPSSISSSSYFLRMHNLLQMLLLLERSRFQQSPNLFEMTSFSSLSVFIKEMSMNSIIFVTMIIINFVRGL